MCVFVCVCVCVSIHIALGIGFTFEKEASLDIESAPFFIFCLHEQGLNGSAHHEEPLAVLHHYRQKLKLIW